MYKSKPLLNILLFVWQLPQIFLGLLLMIFMHDVDRYTNTYNKVSVLRIKHHGLFKKTCFSLGPIICVADGADEEIFKHETGHSKDSILFGWFFFFIICLPSIYFFLYKKLKHKDQDWYLSQWTEVRAEKNGMTDRYKSKLNL